ncbi:Nipped-B-like protein B [Symbiodinium microadriaticum]|uniref:Nipped-B-like protein B n=1 Tax=Symbiodinium microadriaticum TaxID=2951 RepID=A0A1Q9E836_SYMMI|nr:Nipped-B-like protein B [Symbiodinium microadriaticum]
MSQINTSSGETPALLQFEGGKTAPKNHEGMGWKWIIGENTAASKQKDEAARQAEIAAAFKAREERLAQEAILKAKEKERKAVEKAGKEKLPAAGIQATEPEGQTQVEAQACQSPKLVAPQSTQDSGTANMEVETDSVKKQEVVVDKQDKVKQKDKDKEKDVKKADGEKSKDKLKDKEIQSKKESEKDKEKTKDKKGSKTDSKVKEKDNNKAKEAEQHKEKKDKDNGKVNESNKDSDKEKDKNSKEKHKDNSKAKDKSRSRSRRREKSRSRSRSKDKKRKEGSRSRKRKERSRSKDKKKQKEKERSKGEGKEKRRRSSSSSSASRARRKEKARAKEKEKEKDKRQKKSKSDDSSRAKRKDKAGALPDLGGPEKKAEKLVIVSISGLEKGPLPPSSPLRTSSAGLEKAALSISKRSATGEIMACYVDGSQLRGHPGEGENEETEALLSQEAGSLEESGTGPPAEKYSSKAGVDVACGSAGQDSQLFEPLLACQLMGGGKAWPPPANARSPLALCMVLATLSFTIWTLPAPTLLGKLDLLRQSWRLNKVLDEVSELRAKIKAAELEKTNLEQALVAEKARSEDLRERLSASDGTTQSSKTELSNQQDMAGGLRSANQKLEEELEKEQTERKRILHDLQRLKRTELKDLESLDSEISAVAPPAH